MTKPKVCVVIPVYNEAPFIANVLKKILQYPQVDIAVINDGSTDQTQEIVETFPQIFLQKHETNRGKGAALQTGFNFALEYGYSAVITMDGDGQHDPDEIPKFVQATEDLENVFVMGNRMEEKKTMPLVRWLTNRTMSGIVSFLSHTSISDTQCGYRLIGRKILEHIRLTTSKFDTESEILIQSCRLGFPVLQVPIETIYGEESSKIRVVSDTLRFVYLVLRYILKISPRIAK